MSKPNRVIVSVHNAESQAYVREYAEQSKMIIDIINVEDLVKTSNSHYKYNLFFNSLIANVKEGFIWCIDDDDEIETDAIDYIKSNCLDQDILYIFKILLINKNIPSFSWNKRPVLGDIGTPNFVVHSSLAKTEQWTDKQTADGFFIQKLYDKVPKKKFFDKVIYKVKKAGLGK